MKRSFVDEIRTELKQQELDQYYELMRAIKENRIAGAEAFTKLDEIFRGHDNLIVGLKNFVNSYRPIHLSEDDNDDADDEDDDDNDDTDDDSDSNSNSSNSIDNNGGGEVLSEAETKKLEGAVAFVERVKERLRDEKEVFDSFQNTLLKSAKLKLDASAVLTRLSAILEKHPDLISEFEVYSPWWFSETRRGVVRVVAQEEEEEEEEERRPRIRIAPSYVLLKPAGKNIESMNINGGGGDHHQEQGGVLNNVCVSDPPGTVDFSNRAKDGNQEYENIIEDQRFQIDLLLESLKSTASIVRKYLDIIANSEGRKMTIAKEDYLKPRHLRCIEFLYGEDGLDVIAILRWKPKVVLPVLMKRLIQKQEELREFYSDLFRTDSYPFMLGYKSREVEDLDRRLQVAERPE